MFRHQNGRQNHNIRIANTALENAATFTYLGTTITNQNLIHEGVKSRLNSGNAYYHSVPNILSSCLLYNVNTKT
jgi:hypothetical protein